MRRKALTRTASRGLSPRVNVVGDPRARHGPRRRMPANSPKRRERLYDRGDSPRASTVTGWPSRSCRWIRRRADRGRGRWEDMRVSAAEAVRGWAEDERASAAAPFALAGSRPRPMGLHRTRTGCSAMRGAPPDVWRMAGTALRRWNSLRAWRSPGPAPTAWRDARLRKRAARRACARDEPGRAEHELPRGGEWCASELGPDWESARGGPLAGGRGPLWATGPS